MAKMSDAQKKLDQLSKAFDMAAQSLEVLPVEDTSATVTDGDTSMGLPESGLFDVRQLQQDFTTIRSHVMELIATGQSLMRQTQLMDIEELPGSKITAISDLSNSVSANLKLMIQLYKDMRDIEMPKGTNITKNVNALTTNNQTAVFQGSSKQLLEAVNSIRPTNRKPQTRNIDRSKRTIHK